MSSVRAALAAARAQLAESDTPALDAELLLAEVLGRSRTWLHAWPESGLAPEARARFEALLARRAAGEPVAHLRGRQAFWSLDFAVDAKVLIPRPETEGLVEIALEHLDRRAVARPAILDLGTGSGCLAIALARERPDARVTATDASPAALRIAHANAERLGARVDFLQGSWFAPLGRRLFDLILSNPPYVRSDDPHLYRGDLRYEPMTALDGGPDGLDAIRALAAGARPHVAAGGLLAVEHGADQGEAVTALLTQAGWRDIDTRHDPAGLPRITLARGNPRR